MCQPNHQSHIAAVTPGMSVRQDTTMTPLSSRVKPVSMLW